MPKEFLLAFRELGRSIGSKLDLVKEAVKDQKVTLVSGEVSSDFKRAADELTRLASDLRSQDVSKALVNKLDILIEAVRNSKTVEGGSSKPLEEAINFLADSLESEDHSEENTVKIVEAISKSSALFAQTITKLPSESNSKILGEIHKAIGKIKLEQKVVDLSGIGKVEKAIVTLQKSIVPTDVSPLLKEIQSLKKSMDAFKVTFPKEFKFDKMQLSQLTSSWGGVNGENLAARSFPVTRVLMADANTEYSHIFGANTAGYFIKLRSQNTPLFLAHVTGQFPTSGDDTDYITVPQNGMQSPMNLDVGGKTIFLQTGSATQVAEIQEFRLND